jgi:hypothetical protein
MRARELGAAALVARHPLPPDAGEPDKVPSRWLDGPTSRAGIPVVQVTRAVADRWLAAAGTSVDAARDAADAADAAKARRGAVPGARVTGKADVRTTKATARNVVAVLPGSGALADEVVVLGAHYDHLGMGEEGSMRPDAHAIHNGADDNASGSAALVCAMEHLASAPPAGDRRTVVALSFAAEEIGLGGSAWYADHPLLPLDKTVGMINLDMVGRLRDGKISALGSDSAPEWAALIQSAAASVGLDAKLGGDGYGPSDHIVVLRRSGSCRSCTCSRAVTTSTTPPTTTRPLLNVVGGGQVVTHSSTRRVARRGRRARPPPVRATPRGRDRRGPRPGDARGFGAWLGTVPDMTADDGRRDGRRAARPTCGRAGPPTGPACKAGDVLVEPRRAPRCENLYDVSFVLRDHKPGETVDVVVLREGAGALSLSRDPRPAQGRRRGASVRGRRPAPPRPRRVLGRRRASGAGRVEADRRQARARDAAGREAPRRPAPA